MDPGLEGAGLGRAQIEAVRKSSAYGALIASLRRADACGLDVEATFPRLVAARPLFDAEDVAAVLHSRVESWTYAVASRLRTNANFIAGLIPRATGVTDPDLDRALVERDEAIERRARELAERAVARGDAWVRQRGQPPAHPAARERWLTAVSTVAAYRERWHVTDDSSPLGRPDTLNTIEGLRDRNCAATTISRGVVATGVRDRSEDRQLSTVEPTLTPGPDL